MSSTATPPDPVGRPDNAPEGAQLHWRALESLYGSAPVNALFSSTLEIIGEGTSRIEFEVDRSCYHAAGAAHGTIYFKMLDDAAFYAANTLVTDRFLLTTSFNLHFSRPVREGRVVAEGRWVSGRRRVLVAEARLVDAEGEEIGRGTGTFMRSHVALSSLDGYSRGLALQLDARLPAHLEVAALIRRVQGEGGFAMVLGKGEREAGTILIVTAEKGENQRVFERMPQLDGSRKWSCSKHQDPENKELFNQYLERRKAQDPDLWIIELDIANAERFIGGDCQPG